VLVGLVVGILIAVLGNMLASRADVPLSGPPSSDGPPEA
jgi:hypothetical protein